MLLSFSSISFVIRALIVLKRFYWRFFFVKILPLTVDVSAGERVSIHLKLKKKHRIIEVKPIHLTSLHKIGL